MNDGYINVKLTKERRDELKGKSLAEIMETPEIKEAIDGIMKMHGARKVVVASRRTRWRFAWMMRWRRLLHRLGFHTYLPTTKYDPEAGSVQYGGLNCMICGARQ